MFRQDYAQLSIFSGLDGNQISELSPFLEECQFTREDVIFEQGQPADHLYILLSGEVIIRYKPYDGPPLIVARIEPGGVFGWSSALSRDAYTSSATATQDCTVLQLRGSHLPIICGQYPETGKLLIERLASVIAERLRSTHTHILEILHRGMDADSNCERRSAHNDGK